MNIKDISHVKKPPHRDASRIVISCEGAWTEPNYFKYFENASRKLSVHLTGKDEDPSLSAPKWVEDRTKRYIDKVGISEIDEVWLVMDVDRWDEKYFRELFKICKKHPKWNIVLSNPCFEVWLYLHINSKIPGDTLTSQDLKHLLSLMVKGGYTPEEFIPKILYAIKYSRMLEKDSKYYFPAKNTTKVYLLAERLISIMGENQFRQFLETIMHKKG